MVKDQASVHIQLTKTRWMMLLLIKAYWLVAQKKKNDIYAWPQKMDKQRNAKLKIRRIGTQTFNFLQKSWLLQDLSSTSFSEQMSSLQMAAVKEELKTSFCILSVCAHASTTLIAPLTSKSTILSYELTHQRKK